MVLQLQIDSYPAALSDLEDQRSETADGIPHIALRDTHHQRAEEPGLEENQDKGDIVDSTLADPGGIEPEGSRVVPGGDTLA